MPSYSSPKNRRHPDEFKARIASEARALLEAGDTQGYQALCRKHQLHPNMVRRWVREVPEPAAVKAEKPEDDNEDEAEDEKDEEEDNDENDEEGDEEGEPVTVQTREKMVIEVPSVRHVSQQLIDMDHLQLAHYAESVTQQNLQLRARLIELEADCDAFQRALLRKLRADIERSPTT